MTAAFDALFFSVGALIGITLGFVLANYLDTRLLVQKAEISRLEKELAGK